MREFEFEGRKYRFDANECYDGDGHISLPDGRLLIVSSWLEVYPPIPCGVKVSDYLPGLGPTGTPATAVEEK